MKKRFFALVPIIAVFLILTGFTKDTTKDERFSNKINVDGDKSIIIKDVKLMDYIIEDNYAYLMVNDTSGSGHIECLKYDMDTQETTVLYMSEKDIFTNVYSHFLKKRQDSYLIINLVDTIIVIDTDKNVIKEEIVFPEDKLYGDINYSGNRLCYYKKGNLYLADTDFSNEKLLKKDVGDTEDTVQPCFSHDDKKVAYFNDYQVEVIDINGNLQESLPRAARYVKWSQDDKSLIIGANAGGTKIDLENRKIYATHYSEDEYIGFHINYFEDLSCEVIYSGNEDLLAYKMRISDDSDCCNAIGIFDGINQYIMKEERNPSLIRWVSQVDEVAVLYDNGEYQELRIININSDEFKIKSDVEDVNKLEENLYMNDNKTIMDNGQWIITYCLGSTVALNLDTGEKNTISLHQVTDLQPSPLKEWNYTWDYEGIYLTRYDGKENHNIVKAHIFGMFPIDDGLVFGCHNSIYLYDYKTMETNKILFGFDYINDVYRWKNDVYMNISIDEENMLMVYHEDTEKVEELYRNTDIINCHGLINGYLYFNNKEMDCSTKKIIDSDVPLDTFSTLISCNDKVYIENSCIVIGYSEDGLRTIQNFNKLEDNNVLSWYYGKKFLYAIDWRNKTLFKVDPDKYIAVDNLTIVDYEEPEPSRVHVYSMDDKIIIDEEGYDYYFEVQIIDGEVAVTFYNRNIDIGEDTLYLDKQNRFESKKHYKEITSIIKETFKDYYENDDYIAYVSNDNKLKVINRNTMNVTSIFEGEIGGVQLQNHYVYFYNLGTGISQYDILTGTTKQIVKGCIYKYIVNDDKLYYINNYFDRSLYVIDIDNVNIESTKISDYANNLLVVDNKVYYIDYDKYPILYRIDKDKGIFMGILDNKDMDRIFPFSNDEIAYMLNTSFDIIKTDEKQKFDKILFENNDICIFRKYFGNDEEYHDHQFDSCYDNVIGYYDKTNKKILKIEDAKSIDKSLTFNDNLYFISTIYDNDTDTSELMVEKLDTKTLVKNHEMDSECASIFISDGEFLAYRNLGDNKNILYNIKTQESQQLHIEVDNITKIDGEYIYFSYYDYEYKCRIDDLKSFEKVE